MPIEIRELVIRAVVEPDQARARPTLSEQERAQLKREIVTECLDRLELRRDERSRR